MSGRDLTSEGFPYEFTTLQELMRGQTIYAIMEGRYRAHGYYCLRQDAEKKARELIEESYNKQTLYWVYEIILK